MSDQREAAMDQGESISLTHVHAQAADGVVLLPLYVLKWMEYEEDAVLDAIYDVRGCERDLFDHYSLHLSESDVLIHLGRVFPKPEDRVLAWPNFIYYPDGPDNAYDLYTFWLAPDDNDPLYRAYCDLQQHQRPGGVSKFETPGYKGSKEVSEVTILIGDRIDRMGSGNRSVTKKIIPFPGLAPKPSNRNEADAEDHLARIIK